MANRLQPVQLGPLHYTSGFYFCPPSCTGGALSPTTRVLSQPQSTMLTTLVLHEGFEPSRFRSSTQSRGFIRATRSPELWSIMISTNEQTLSNPFSGRYYDGDLSRSMNLLLQATFVAGLQSISLQYIV